MAYSMENALFQWREGERRVADTPEPARADLERAVAVVVDELRKLSTLAEAQALRDAA